MKNDMIHLLVSFDQNYIRPFQTMVKSLSASNPNEIFQIFLLHSSIPPEELHGLGSYCNAHRILLKPILVDRAFFEKAPVTQQYPREMYYRLLAPLLLPNTLDRVLYIDPDILVLNAVRPLWEIQLENHIFAAASHSGIFDTINGLNRVRLGKEHDYFNTGVLLMDLSKARKVMTADQIFNYVREQADKLILPDQDVFNVLHGYDILQVDDAIWNYDVRYFSSYLQISLERTEDFAPNGLSISVGAE